MELKIEKVERSEKMELPEDLPFGVMFADHMFEMDYVEGEGWKNAKIKKTENLSLHPAAAVLHYGQEIFEGMKAYRHPDNRIALFRPMENLKRFNKSAARMCMPEIPTEFVLKALKELLKIDQDWVPKYEGQSLYLRPFMIATDAAIGVRASSTYKFMIIMTPVGLYYPQGMKPVPIKVSTEHVRASKKGVGEAKCGGNYAGSLLAQKIAKEEGYAQVLWLDAKELKYIEEVGTMNIFIQFKDEVATPALNGSILPGITRMSCIQIIRDWGYTVNERMVSIDELNERYEKGELVEMIGTGTAAAISCVGKLKVGEKVLNITDQGDLSLRLYNELMGIQFGKVEDRYGWVDFIDE